MHSLIPVILSGGSGTRLWPLSREKYPKQLLPLINEDSLLQATIKRLDGLTGITIENPLIVCNEEYRFVIAEQLRLIGKACSILLEPFGRNTAPALTLAALVAAQNNADPILLVMPSDHVIVNASAFQACISKGVSSALQNSIVTFGIAPDAPETGYGYIQTGELLGDVGITQIARFVEKPNQQTAQAYIDDGSYLWNSGIFMVRASVWLAAINQCRPDIFSTCQTAWNKGSHEGNFIRVNETAFTACPNDSIDYAVMEKLSSNHPSLPSGVVIEFSGGWSDVGAWDSLWQVLPKDEAGNVSRGDVILHECKNTLAISENRLVACVGVENLTVVETPDAILVVHKNRTQDVKKIVDSLKLTKRVEVILHRKIFRPWGWYDAVDAGERFQVKRIVVKPGAALSLQMHHHRAEHWIVVRGTAKVTRDDKSYLVSENESTYIPLGTRHRLENPGRLPLEMIEVQSGSYLGEDDIVRFEDIYGRNEAYKPN